MKRLKEYKLAIEYHPEKANVVADALNRKIVAALASLRASVRVADDGSLLTEMTARPIFLSQILEE